MLNDLLKILDTSEDEQWDWVSNQWQEFSIDPSWRTKEYRNMALADLAFRLRDEVCNPKTYTKCCENYHEALEEVYNYRIKDKQCCSLYAWQAYQIRPIDMIIAALIAKGQK